MNEAECSVTNVGGTAGILKYILVPFRNGEGTRFLFFKNSVNFYNEQILHIRKFKGGTHREL